MKTTITTIISIIFCLVFVTESQAAYNTGDTGASASVQQKLYLTILPAFESVEFNSSISEEATKITETKIIAVRSNTNWQLSITPYSTGFVYGPYCYSSDNVGLSNGQAGVGDGLQFINVTCVQPTSWGDDSNASFSFAAEVGPNVSL